MGRVRWSRTPRADVAILSRNLELWPVLRQVVAGYSTYELETIGTPINMRDAFSIARHLVADKATVGYSAMAAQLRRADVKVLLAVDQTSQAIEELGRLLPHLSQVIVAHGSIRADGLQLHHVRRREKRILCVWGESDVDVYRKNIPNPVDCRIVGSLRNAGFLQAPRVEIRASVQHPLLFVSQYAGADEEDTSNTSSRVRVLRMLKHYVHRFCQERNLPLQIALRPPVSAPSHPLQTADEIRHYQQVFDGVTLGFSDPSQPYSSYVASDLSDVTIGVPTGLLTESFARGNKVLMLQEQPESDGYYKFPIAGPWLLTEPRYEEFASRLDLLRSQKRENLAGAWQRQREYMVANATADRAIGLVRQFLDCAIRGETL